MKYREKGGERTRSILQGNQYDIPTEMNSEKRATTKSTQCRGGSGERGGGGGIGGGGGGEKR